MKADPKQGFYVNAGTGGDVQIVAIQRPGKKIMPAADFLRGMKIIEGEILA